MRGPRSRAAPASPRVAEVVRQPQGVPHRGAATVAPAAAPLGCRPAARLPGRLATSPRVLAGACALTVAAVLAGKAERTCKVSLPGGDLQIEWRESNNRIYMTGPAEPTFRGEYTVQ